MTTPSSPDPMDLPALVLNVQELNVSVRGLTDAMLAERQRRDQQRKRDWIALTVLLAILVGIVSNRLYAQSNARTNCQSINATNSTIRSLFAPFNVFVPTPIPAGSTDEEIAKIKKADAERKAASDRFFADLKDKTEPKDC